MFQRLVFTIATAGSLIGLYALYSVALRPIVVIPELPQQAVEEFEGNDPELPAENVRVAETHIPATKWAASSQHTLRIEDGFVYTDDWSIDEESKKTVTFEPFAIVWLVPNKETGKEDAVSMTSESAQVEFASTFDEKNRNPGRIVRAMLNGHVEVSGPQEFHAKGRNFVFDESSLSLFTWNPVHFRFQSHVGWASRMEVKLIPAEGLPGVDRPHVRGIETVRLIAGANLNPRDPKSEFVKLQIQLPNGDEKIPIKVRCAGDLEYTVATNTAVLSQDVIACNGVGKAEDWLECDTLTLQFAAKTPIDQVLDSNVTEVVPPGEPSRRQDFDKPETNLEFSWLEAACDQSSGRFVKIRSHSRGIKANMARLTYSADSRTLIMDSEQSDHAVAVMMNRSELHSPKIEAQLGQETLTSLQCLGMGHLELFDDQTGLLRFTAKWQKHLSMRPDETTQLDVIELAEKAQFLQPDQKTALGADLIKIWFVPTSIKFDLSSTPSKDGQSDSTPEPEPKRLLATGDVALVSAQLQIERTHSLDVIFEALNPAASSTTQQIPRKNLRPAGLIESTDHRTSRTTTAKTAPGRSKADSSGVRPQIGFANIPAESDGSLGPAVEIPFASSKKSKKKPSQTTTTNEPFVVSANSIFARMLRTDDGENPELRELRTQGHVVITQKRKDEPKPFRLEGDHILVQSRAKDHEIINIIGVPAIIQNSQFQLEGKDIHLDRGSNRAWVNGTGEIKLAVPENYAHRMTGRSMGEKELKSTRSEKSAHDQGKSTLASHLRVRWNEKMDFNGTDANFFGRVEAKLGLSKMHCEQMLVKLNEFMSFQSDNIAANPDLKLIRCHEKVSFENSSYLGTNLIEVYRGEVGEFTLYYAGKETSAGEVVAQGPGEIRAWRRQQQDAKNLAPTENIQANRPISTEVTEWKYTQVQFEGQLKGNFDGEIGQSTKEQSATIDDRVEVIYGPVRLPNEKVNPDKLPSGGGTMRCHRLRVINHSETPQDPKGYLELIGEGNAEVEGQVNKRTFTASADIISYDGSQGLFRLKAMGKQNARLTGIGIGNQSGQQIEFNPDPKLRILHVSGATHGQFSR